MSSLSGSHESFGMVPLGRPGYDRLLFRSDQMAETPEQYIARILAHVGPEDPMQILAATPARIGTALAGRSDDDLRWTPAPERWNIAAIVTHLADAEVVAAYRLRMILANPGTPIQAFDQNQWA